MIPLRTVVPCALLLVFLVAGCIVDDAPAADEGEDDRGGDGADDADADDDDAPGEDDDATGGPRPPSSAAPPKPIHATGTMAGSFDPLNFAGEEPCSTPTAQCLAYPFQVSGGPVDADIRLSWEYPFSDFDLYVYENGVQVDTSGNSPPETSEAIRIGLDKGSYEIRVVGWLVVLDTFTLDASFE